MSAVTDEIVEKLKGLTLLEASELVKQIEEAFGVSAAATGGGMMMMPGMMPGAPAEEVEEQTEFSAILEDVPADKKIAVLKVVRTITGLGLKEAKDLVEAAPKPLKEAASKAECEDIKKQIEEAGGKVAIK
jgi:large subunit ribosomal protein L7/L12